MFKLICKFISPYKWWLVGLIIFQCLQTLGTLFLPDLNSQIINQGVLKGDQQYIWSTGGLMLLFSLLQVGCWIVAIYFGTRLALKISQDIRSALFNKVQHISEYEVGVFGIPSLITRETNDVNQVQQFLMFAFTIIIGAPLTLIGGIFFALQQNVELSLIFVIIIPILVIVAGLFLKITVPLFTKVQKLVDNVNLIIREQLDGIRVIKAFNQEKKEQQRFDLSNQDLVNINFKIGLCMSFIMPFVFFLINLTNAGIVYFGGQLIDEGSMEMGSLTAYITYAMYILMSFMMATMVFMMFPRANVSSKRINMVLNIENSVLDTPNPQEFPKKINTVAYKDVEFYYKGAKSPILKNISFQAKENQTISIIGATGSGKSTIIKMLPRLFDQSSGEISINGIPTKDFSLEDLRNSIGYVPQKAFLFSGTLRENLKYGKEEASDLDCFEALRVAGALELLELDPKETQDLEKEVNYQKNSSPQKETPHKIPLFEKLAEALDKHIEQKGENLSGGQQQRVALARAVIKNPAILVLDDSYSALDANTEREVQNNLAQVQGLIKIVVSQKVSSIENSDLILVLDHGQIVGQGTHQELLQTNSHYQEIVQSQKNLGADFDE